MKSLAVVLVLLIVAACTGRPEGVEPVRGFDVTRYGGQWFEIMRLDHSFERGLVDVSASYTLRPDGSIGVLNRGYDPKGCRWKEADGRAVFQDSRDVASLSVTFFWPFAGGYHVVELDPDYRWAMVSGPTRGYLWILARRTDLAPDIRDRLVGRARALGFPVDDLILVEHGRPVCTSAGGMLRVSEREGSCFTIERAAPAEGGLAIPRQRVCSLVAPVQNIPD